MLDRFGDLYLSNSEMVLFSEGKRVGCVEARRGAYSVDLPAPAWSADSIAASLLLLFPILAPKLNRPSFSCGLPMEGGTGASELKSLTS